MPIVSKQVDGITGLVQAVLEIKKEVLPGSFLWFRGHGRKKYNLLPKIMREGKSSDHVFEREVRLLTRFRQSSLAYWPAGYPQDNWEHLFAMQHFGMPTRLLDWSENLFVAAHFALTERSADEIEKDDFPVIWLIDPIAWNRSTPVLSEYADQIQVLTTTDEEIDSYRTGSIKRKNKSPVAIFGTHNSSRIVAQRGTFMVWGNEVKILEDFASDEQSAGRLWRLEILGCREDLAKDLSALGFGETMVFPELPSLAAELTRIEGWRI